MNANNITFEIDFDNDDILIRSILDGRQQVNRLRILHAWVLLYCLDPARFEDGCPTMVLWEQVMAPEPPIGMVSDDGMIHVCLTDGRVVVPEAAAKAVADVLEHKLHEYTESMGVEVDHDLT